MSLPRRKRTRLHRYDYGQNGAYFVTICTAHRKPILSKISVGQGLAPAEIHLTPYGIIAQKQLLALPDRYPTIHIDNFVIMPNHIHILLSVENTPSATVRATVIDAMRVFKSLTVRECKRFRPIDQVFQTSYNDHIIRGQQDYESIWEYIDHNPMHWLSDRFYTP